MSLGTIDPSSPSIGQSLRDFVILSKPRISVMVLFTVAVAGLISATTGGSALSLVHAMVGLFFVSASGCALNQYLERYVDWIMPRTTYRPLPDSRLTSRQVALFGAVTFGIGMAYLITLVNWQTTAVAGLTWILYVWIYTPMKGQTWLNTYVGAVAGALPVLVGSTAVTGGSITTAAWMLFAVLYIWQFPHFMAIAWLYQDDYRLAGLKMIPVDDPRGWRTAVHAIGFAIVLIPVAVISVWSTGVWGLMLTGMVGLISIWYLRASIVFATDQAETTARKLFRVSLVYLPLYLVVLSVSSQI